MGSSADLLRQALAAHQMGRLDEAEDVYRRLLADDPDHADALHLLGVLSSQSGRLDEAVRLIDRAIERRPDDPTFHLNLAMVYERAQRRDAALASLERAARLLERAGKAADAANVRARIATNRVAGAAGRSSQEIELRRAVERNGDDAEAHRRLGSWLMSQRRVDEALVLLRRAAALRPDSAEAQASLGAALYTAGLGREAYAAMNRAADLAPRDFEAQVLALMARRWTDAGDWVPRARELIARALAIGPASAHQWNQLGAAHNELLEVQAACACYDRAIQLGPPPVLAANAHFNLALTLLLKGDFERGWEEFEWRTTAFPPVRRRDRLPPPWRGEDVTGKTILLYMEGGAGDAVHFVRYAGMVRERGAAVVVLDCEEPLIGLMKSVVGVDEVVAAGTPWAAEAAASAQFSSPLQSLPRIFGTRLETIPSGVRYLSVEPGARLQWQQRLGSRQRLRVGIVWSGSERPGLSDDLRTRSVEIFAPLAAVTGVELFSLQKGPQATQASSASFKMNNLTSDVRDFADSAALIENLDLVVSVDTSVAHLAGALGKPVWVLLPCIPDFRWLLDRTDSPWYPTMRLYRQALGGAWSAVMSRVAADLADLVEQAGSPVVKSVAGLD